MLVFRCGYLFKSINANNSGEQSSGPVPRLQRPLDVRDGASGDAVSPGVHVPGDPPTAELHELRGTAVVSADSLPHWDTRYVPYV